MTSPLITVAELAQSLTDTRLVLLDVRWGGPGSTSGREEFAAGHIPGARFVDLDTALAAPGVGDDRGRHPLPSADDFEAAMRDLGVDNDSRVVVYDAWKSIPAARAWWLLRHYGHDDVLVLDGGWTRWRAEGRPVSTDDLTPSRGNFAASEPRLVVVGPEEASRLGTEGLLVDGRPAGRFRGENETIDPVAGHVPGARSVPAVELATDSGLLPPDELRAKFETAGGLVEGSVAYCGSGIQASQLALAAVVAGLPEPGIYEGSWSGWVTDPTRPAETGPAA